MKATEFGFFIDEIKQNLKEIENGAHVYNGMMHKDRIILILKHITKTLEAHLEADTKQYVELEAKATELDRREKGVLVVENSVYSSGTGDYMDYFVCGGCGFAISQHFEPEHKYCAGCGTKLIWDSEVK